MLHDDEFIWNIEAANRSHAPSTPHRHVYIHQHLYEYNEEDNMIKNVDREHNESSDLLDPMTSFSPVRTLSRPSHGEFTELIE